MAVITGSEKANTGVGRGINMLKAKRVAKDQVSTYTLFNMDKLAVEGMSENATYVDVITENSKYELAKSLSISVGAEAKYMMFSASASVDYESSSTSSKEKAYTKVYTKVTKKRHYFPDDSHRRHLYPSFMADLNGNMSPAALFDKYGTHYIREAGVGGVLDMSLTTTKDSNDSKESISSKVKASFGKIASGNFDSETKKDVTSFLEKSDYRFKTIGGKNLVSLNLENFFKEYPSWVQSVSNDSGTWEFSYLPNDNSVAPIWDLVSNAARKKAIRTEYERQAAIAGNRLEDIEMYVSDIRISSDSSKSNARFSQSGYTLVDQDLNEGAKGNFIYISYRTIPKSEFTKTGRKPITNLLMVQSSKALNWSAKTLTDGNGRRASYTRINSDLNKGAGGQFIYLCYTTSNIYPPLVAVNAYKDENRPGSNEWDTVTWEQSYSLADVNKGAGGRYIYVLQKHKS